MHKLVCILIVHISLDMTKKRASMRDRLIWVFTVCPMGGNLNFFTHTAKALIKGSILIWRESTLFLFVLSCHGLHAINRFFHVVALFSPKILFFMLFRNIFRSENPFYRLKARDRHMNWTVSYCFLFLAPTHMSSDSYLKTFSKSRLCSMAYSAFTNRNIVVCRYA